MDLIIHEPCNNASAALHHSLNANFSAKIYYLAMKTREEAGRRIKAAREALGMTLQDVCGKVPGLTVSRLSNWEQGLRMISVEQAKRLGPVFKVSPEYILTLQDETGLEESKLLELFRNADARGKRELFRYAESQQAEIGAPNHLKKA